MFILLWFLFFTVLSLTCFSCVLFSPLYRPYKFCSCCLPKVIMVLVSCCSPVHINNSVFLHSTKLHLFFLFLEIWHILQLAVGYIFVLWNAGKYVRCHFLTADSACHCPHWNINNNIISVDKKNQQDVTFCILYFSSNSCWTCFGQPCTHHQELTTAWCYSLVLVCAVAAGRWSGPVGRY